MDTHTYIHTHIIIHTHTIMTITLCAHITTKDFALLGMELLAGPVCTNNIITCADDVMSAWVTHFETLGSSKVQESPLLQQLQSTIPLLHSLSLNNEDYVLDVPITIEEIEGAIAKLKRGKSSGPDGILLEHIIYGGLLFDGLKRIFTTIIDLEAVPPSLLNAIRGSS